MIATKLNVLLVSWLTAVLAGLVIASAIAYASPLPAGYYTPEQAKAKIAEYSQDWEQQHYSGLAAMYEGLAQWAESQATRFIPTGYPLIDDVLPDPDVYYQQAAKYRELAEQYRAMTQAEQLPEGSQPTPAPGP